MAKKGSQFKKYDYQFKLTVVESYFSGKYGSQNEVCAHFGIRSVTQLKNWVALYQQSPELLAQDNRGKHATGRPKSVQLEQMVLLQSFSDKTILV